MVDYKIRTFLTLYDTMNYHTTAEVMCISQPTVTQQIKALESEYGCKLFLYNGKKLSRTKQADILAEYARSAIYNERKMRGELTRRDIEPVRMGATKTIGEFVIGDNILGYLKNRDRSMSIAVDNTEKLLWMLEHDEIDFAMIEGAFDKSKYEVKLYQKASFVGLCSENHKFAGKTVGFDDLKGESAVLREKGSGTRAIFENILDEYGYSVELFDRIICISNFSLICKLVRENIGITFAYSAVAKEQRGLARFELEPLPKEFEFNFVYLKGTGADKLIYEVFGV